MASNHHGHKKPHRPFSPPTKHLALPQHLGQTAQLPQRRLLSRGNDRSRLTVSQPQPSTRLIFKVLRFSGCAAAQLACDGLASAFTSPKSFVLAASGFYFRLQRASSPAQRLRQRRGVFTQKHCWRRAFALKPPTLPHGVAVSAARWVGPRVSIPRPIFPLWLWCTAGHGRPSLSILSTQE